ncbi:MAG: tRNA (cmo5U34)-methyltransferase [Verrucomicrobiota bacterium]|jgi:SAM-dependent methyltransferase
METNETEFDRVSENYEENLQMGLSLSGESMDYFAKERVRHTARFLQDDLAGRILDFGCGTGTATPFLLRLPGAEQIVGFDPSEKSIAMARKRWIKEPAVFVTTGLGIENNSINTAFCNGVFHHIPPSERPSGCQIVYSALRPGGIFAYWENNPWNPGTRWIMSRIPFDRDAITLTPPESRRMLRDAGFEVLRTDYLFFFPRSLSALRFLDPLLRPIPMGAQYLVLCRKPI